MLLLLLRVLLEGAALVGVLLLQRRQRAERVAQVGPHVPLQVAARAGGRNETAGKKVFSGFRSKLHSGSAVNNGTAERQRDRTSEWCMCVSSVGVGVGSVWVCVCALIVWVGGQVGRWVGGCAVRCRWVSEWVRVRFCVLLLAASIGNLLEIKFHD